MRHYYQDLRKNEKYNIITVGSEKGFTKNVKNVQRNQDGTMPDQGLKHYQYILKEMLMLSDKDRKIILNVFNGNNIINQ